MLNDLLLMLAEIAKYQAPMQARIAKLPTWEDWMQQIQPEVAQAMNGHTAAVGKCQRALQQDFRAEMESLKMAVTESMGGKMAGLEQTLRARDTAPWKLRLKWGAIGASIPMLCWGLLWVWRIFW